MIPLRVIRWASAHSVYDDIDQSSGERWYPMKRDNTIWVVTNRGTLRYTYKRDFHFDGRSGGPLVDIVLPNLGTENDVICWLIHDLNGYATYLSFEDTNEMLRQMLRLSGKVRLKASLAHWTVSRSRAWYGDPKRGDREYINIFPEPLFNVFPFSSVNMG